MNQPLIFTKMHGLGNDFILIDNWDGRVENPAALARALCRRRLSAGADGLILAEPSNGADAKMYFFNADGSEAEMCGNGIRCFARFLHDQGLVRAEHMRIETLAGIMQPELVLRQGEVVGVNVDMGLPEFAPESVPTRGTGWGDALEAEGERLLVYSLRMGVPHAVILVENAEDSRWMRVGAQIEGDTALFPERVNVNFVQMAGEDTAVIRTYERGAGPTLACGTGSCAAAAVLNRLGLAGQCVRICHAPGDLLIRLTPSAIFMQGPAEYVYRGEWLGE